MFLSDLSCGSQLHCDSGRARLVLSGRKGCERESLSHINEETQLGNKIQIKILNAVEFDLLFRLNDMFIFAHSALVAHYCISCF